LFPLFSCLPIFLTIFLSRIFYFLFIFLSILFFYQIMTLPTYRFKIRICNYIPILFFILFSFNRKKYSVLGSFSLQRVHSFKGISDWFFIIVFVLLEQS